MVCKSKVEIQVIWWRKGENVGGRPLHDQANKSAHQTAFESRAHAPNLDKYELQRKIVYYCLKISK